MTLSQVALTPLRLIRHAHHWLAGTDIRNMPLRVQTDLNRLQQNTEILIGWFQLGALSFFFFLFLVSPESRSQDTTLGFDPVPWFFLIYALFNTARLVLAHKRRLPYWVLLLSVVMDMVLLMGLMWTYHLEYGQPPSFYLKDPTLMLAFMFIAMRALRFDPGFVVLSGLVACLGWVFMTWYALHIEPHMLTTSYDVYMTSNSILIGAEVHKITSIALVTLILTVSISRGRKLLVRSILDRTAAEDLSRFVPSAVVRQMQAADQRMELGQTEVREATIFFTDIEAFTSIGESLEPPELVQVLNEYFAVVSKPIEGHGGAINQFQGDAILASFNLPTADPDHAANAIRAALAVQEALANASFTCGVTLRSRVGINTGTVVGGLVGTPDRLGYTVHGDDVNVAARLEQMNKEHGTRIMVSEKTMRAAGADNFNFRKLGSVPVRGRTTEVNIYTLDTDPNT